MRNKIKYAGVTAVALLTVAPMITSSLNPILVKASPIVEAGNLNSKESSEITSMDFQYPAEITVEEGSPISDIKDKYADARLVDKKTGNVIAESSRVSTVETFFYLQPKRGTETRSFANFSLEDGDTYYRYVSAIFDKEAKEYLLNSELLTNNGSSDISGLSISTNYDNRISFFQKITVVSSEQPKDISGVAIVNHDNNFYHLYNTDNEVIDHRALAANSHWQVDKVRTVNGEKQYRVSTNEWIHASDVTFIENAEVNYGMTITPLTQAQQISLDGDGHYRLHNSDMEISDHRALSGGTNWLVDKIGRDAHGGVYYGVSTNEFVKAGDGVNIVK